jgi:pimeloyl-ACP methyl ester carboxylesterase
MARLPTPIGDTVVLTAGSGAPVVLLPGTNFTSCTWLDVIDTLAAKRRVLAVDLPGQPGLSAPARPREPAAYGQWLPTVLSELGLTDAVLVGHSLGGRIALLGASQGPPVSSLALFNPAGLTRLRVTARVLAETLPWLVRPTPRAAERLVGLMTTRPVPQYLAEWMSLVGRHVRTSLAPAPLSDDVLQRVVVPVRVYAGQHDPFLPGPALAKGAARLRATAVVTVAGAGHLLPHERPELVLSAVGAA